MWCSIWRRRLNFCVFCVKKKIDWWFRKQTNMNRRRNRAIVVRTLPQNFWPIRTYPLSEAGIAENLHAAWETLIAGMRLPDMDISDSGKKIRFFFSDDDDDDSSVLSFALPLPLPLTERPRNRHSNTIVHQTLQSYERLPTTHLRGTTREWRLPIPASKARVLARCKRKEKKKTKRPPDMSWSSLPTRIFTVYVWVESSSRLVGSVSWRRVASARCTCTCAWTTHTIHTRESCVAEWRKNRKTRGWRIAYEDLPCVVRWIPRINISGYRYLNLWWNRLLERMQMRMTLKG